MFMLPNLSITPPNVVTKQLFVPQGNFATGGNANAVIGADTAGPSLYTNNSAGNSDRVETTIATTYGQLHSGLVICKFNTIVGSVFPRIMYVDNGGASNYLNLFGRHTTNILFLQLAVAGSTFNFTTNSAAIVPGTVQAFGYTLDGTSVDGGYSPVVYVNGVAVTVSGSTPASALTTGTSCRVTVMNDFAASANPMQGHVFAAMHWNRVLPAAEMMWASCNWPKLVRYHC